MSKLNRNVRPHAYSLTYNRLSSHCVCLGWLSRRHIYMRENLGHRCYLRYVTPIARLTALFVTGFNHITRGSFDYCLPALEYWLGEALGEVSRWFFFLHSSFCFLAFWPSLPSQDQESHLRCCVFFHAGLLFSFPVARAPDHISVFKNLTPCLLAFTEVFSLNRMTNSSLRIGMINLSALVSQEL